MTKKIIFYDTMHYPRPEQEDYYRYINEISRKEQDTKHRASTDIDRRFSRDIPCALMDEYRTYILSLQSLFMSLPFVKQIYLCNSITFNALHPWSDIDICIICRQWYLRAARIRSVIFFLIYKVKRSWGKYANHSKKFCLSFSIDESATDLYPIRNTEGDRYLVYRLAHCVLLYSDDTLADDFLWQSNSKLLSFLPQHPWSQTIHIGIDVIRGTTRWKKYIERINQTWLCRGIIMMLSRVRKQRIYYKRKKLSVHIQKHIIISNTMLKFYDDKRRVIQHKIRTALSKW